MTQGRSCIGLCLDIAHAGKVLIILCPPSGMSQTDIGTLIVHILGLNDDRSVVRLRLLGLSQGRIRQVIGESIGSLASTCNSDGGRSHVLHTNTIDFRIGIVGLANEGGRISRCASLMLFKSSGGLGGGTSDIDGVNTNGQRVTTIVIQIKLNTIGILANHTTGKVVVVEFQRVAGVILQGNSSHGMLILI